MELVEFLLARVVEDEEAARFAAADVGWAPPGPERVQSGAKWTTSYHVVVRSRAVAGAPVAKRAVADCGTLGISPAEHIARHDPARVLAECDAKRRIVERSTEAMGMDPGEGLSDYEYGNQVAWIGAHRGVLQLLALPYADHPDYDAAWQS